MLVLGTLSLLGQAASAHMVPAQHGTMNVVGDAVFVVLSLPSSALHGADDNGDKRLSPEELAAHEAEVRAEVVRRVRVTSGGHPGEVEFFQASLADDAHHPESSGESKNFLVLMKTNFKAPPVSLGIELDFFGAMAEEQRMTIRAIRGPENETMVLTPERIAHRFFSPPPLPLGESVMNGLAHILSAVDQLLFLLALVGAAIGLRSWLVAAMSFFVAHSLALTLSLVGIVGIPLAMVEPLVAVALVMMSILNLRPGTALTARRIALGLAGGSLFGFGLASAMADEGLLGVGDLAGMALGVALGQWMVLGLIFAVVLTVGAIRRRSRADGVAEPAAQRPGARRVAQAMWILIALVGAGWFVERVFLR